MMTRKEFLAAKEVEWLCEHEMSEYDIPYRVTNAEESGDDVDDVMVDVEIGDKNSIGASQA